MFETVCAFLNTQGGHLVIGINDFGEVIGVDEASKDKMKKDFITTLNNPEKMFPPVCLSIDEYTIDNKIVLYCYVAESVQVHRCGNKIFVRRENGDFDISKMSDAIGQVYIKKQNISSENKIYEFVSLTDLKQDLIAKVKIMAVNTSLGTHPWQHLTMNKCLNLQDFMARIYQQEKKGII